MKSEVTLLQLARIVGGAVTGDGQTLIRGIAGLRDAGPGDITFLANRKYAKLLASTRASAVVISNADDLRTEIPTLAVPNPDLAFAQIAEHFNGAGLPIQRGVHPTAVVSPDARLGKNVAVGAHVVIEAGVQIGDGTVLFPQVYVGSGTTIGNDCVLYPMVVVREHCVVGSRVILHSGCAIGTDGFGYATHEGRHHKIPQNGIVVIEDDVEIGSNSCVARARFDRTLIRKGTKLDNLVQIAHNVEVGENCLFAAQVGIAGSTKLGSNIVVGGQAGIGGHLEVGDGCMISGQAALTKSLKPGSVVSGYIAMDHKVYMRQLAALRRLPTLLREFDKLQQRFEALERERKKHS